MYQSTHRGTKLGNLVVNNIRRGEGLRKLFKNCGGIEEDGRRRKETGPTVVLSWTRYVGS